MKFTKENAFSIERFLNNGPPNETPMFFLRLPGTVLTYGDALTETGFYVAEWLERHNIENFKHDVHQNKAYLIFETLSDRQQMEVLFKDLAFEACRKSEYRYPKERHLLEFIANAEHGYYLGSGHAVKKLSEAETTTVHQLNYDIFCWLRRTTKSPYFFYNAKFFFTDETEEMQFKLRWT